MLRTVYGVLQDALDVASGRCCSAACGVGPIGVGAQAPNEVGGGGTMTGSEGVVACASIGDAAASATGAPVPKTNRGGGVLAGGVGVAVRKSTHPQG